MASANDGLAEQRLNYLGSPVVSFGRPTTPGDEATGGVAGSVFRFVSSAGVSPSATAADKVLASFTIPAGSLDSEGRGLHIRICGAIVSSANTKQMKVIFNPATANVGQTVGAGGTTIGDTGSLSTTTSFVVESVVYKTGALGSNTQLGQQLGGSVTAAALFSAPPVAATANESADILVAITGNAGTLATDILLKIVEITALN